MPPEPGTPRILFIASGAAPLALTVLSMVETRFADHQVDLVVSEPLLGKLSPDQQQRVVLVAGRNAQRLQFLRRARQESYWMVAVLLAGQPGYFTMKVAALLLGLGRVVVCYNENAHAFALDRHHIRIVFAHIANRLGAGRHRVVRRSLWCGLQVLLCEPVGLCWMLLSVGLGRLDGFVHGGAVLRSLQSTSDASIGYLRRIQDPLASGDPIQSEDAFVGTSRPHDPAATNTLTWSD